VSNPIYEASARAGVNTATGRPTPHADRGPAAVSTVVYGPEIPDAILAAAEESANNPYTCLAVCRAFEPAIAATLRHLVVHSGNRVLGILSHYERQSTIVVVNRLVEFDDEILEHCVRALFAAHPAAHRIVIDGVYGSGVSRGRRHAGPRRAWCSMENMTLTLPTSFEQYLGHFGAKTRKNLRYCAKRFQRDNPGAELVILPSDAIDEAVVNGIIRLNQLRMTTKGRVSGIDCKFAAGLLALCRSHGVACIAHAEDGRILGGTLCTRVGDGLSLQVIAHDPQFNHVRLGLLCLLKSIETGIAAGANVFHFLWGDSEYKALFGARAAPLLSYRYYRSWLHYVFSLDDWREQTMQSTRRYAKRLRAASRRAGKQ